MFKNFTKFDLLESIISFSFGLIGAVMGLIFMPNYIPTSHQNFAAICFLFSFVVGYFFSTSLSTFFKNRQQK